jgi:hypothetical protein
VSTEHDDADLERLLRAPKPPIDDDGFTDRLLARLPPRRRTEPWRVTILLGFTLAAALVGVLVPGVRELMFGAPVDLVLPGSVLPVTAAVLVAMALWGATALATAEP